MTNTTTTATLRKQVDSARAAYKRAADESVKVSFLCAAATWAVSDAGLIGKGMADQGGWNSQADYAAGFTSSRGKSLAQSSVTMFRRMGRALALNVPEATVDQIAQVWGDKRISEVLDSGTKAAIVKAVKSIHTPDGKRIPAPKPDTSDTAGKGGTGETDGNTPDVPQTRNNSTTLDALETVAARLSAKMSKAEQARLSDLIDGLAERLAVAQNGGKPLDVEAAA